MPLIASDKGGDFKQVSPGTHIARCVQVIDLGTHHDARYDKTLHKILLTWEITDEKVQNKDGEEMPMLLSKKYTLSLGDKATLRKDLQSWRGKPFTDDELNAFDVFSITGAPCMLNVVHNVSNGKTYANVEAIMPMIKGMECPKAAHDLVTYEITEHKNAGSYLKLPEWLKKQINESIEWSMMKLTAEPAGTGTATEPAEEEPLPF